MKCRLLAFIAGSLVVALVNGGFYYQQNKDFTAWMESPKIDVFLESLSPPKESGEKNYWDQSHWIYAVEARLQNNVVQYRVKYGDAPSKGHPYWWFWYVNFTKAEFDKLNQRLTADGFILAYKNQYTAADGESRYQAVWQKVR